MIAIIWADKARCADLISMVLAPARKPRMPSFLNRLAVIPTGLGSWNTAYRLSGRYDSRRSMTSGMFPPSLGATTVLTYLGRHLSVLLPRLWFPMALLSKGTQAPTVTILALA